MKIACNNYVSSLYVISKHEVINKTYKIFLILQTGMTHNRTGQDELSIPQNEGKDF